MRQLNFYTHFLIIISVVSVFPCALFAASGTGAEKITYKKLPTITAVLKKYDIRHADSAITYWVRLSPIGMRVRDHKSGSEVIKDFQQERVWLIDSKNRTNLEIDVQFYRQHFPDQLRYLLGVASISNVPGLEPCFKLQGANNGKRLWRGQIVDEWICSSADGLQISTQLFSQRWKLVVQVQHADMNVVELVDIKEEQALLNEFVPDESLNIIELSEFLGGNKQLDLFSP